MTTTSLEPSICFDRIAVLGPVEAALRFIRTAREVGDERGRRLHVVAFHADPRRSDAAGRAADEVVALSADRAARVRRGAGRRRGRRAVARMDVGGGGSDHRRDLRPPRRHGSSVPMRRTLGRDRIAVKLLAESAGLRVVPWNGGALTGPDAAVDAADALGFPVMLKAAAGGGASRHPACRQPGGPARGHRPRRGRGAGVVRRRHACTSRRCSTGARHLEVTVVADAYGKVWTFGPHDATLRRRGDKVVIESAGAYLTRGRDPGDARRRRDHRAASAGYRGVATVAFLHVPGGGLPRFLEVYPRLPPEHGLIEETTGVDLVRLQLHVGAGRPPRRRAAPSTRPSPCRPGSTPRTPSGGSPRRRVSWPACGSVPARASGSTPPSLRATSSARRPDARRPDAGVGTVT